MRIAIDVMGGDHAPDAILAGSLDAVALLHPTDRLVLGAVLYEVLAAHVIHLVACQEAGLLALYVVRAQHRTVVRGGRRPRLSGYGAC